MEEQFEQVVRELSYLTKKVDALTRTIDSKHERRDPRLADGLMNVNTLAEELFPGDNVTHRTKVYRVQKILNDYCIEPCLRDWPNGPYYFYKDVLHEVRRHKWETEQKEETE